MAGYDPGPVAPSRADGAPLFLECHFKGRVNDCFYLKLFSESQEVGCAEEAAGQEAGVAGQRTRKVSPPNLSKRSSQNSFYNVNSVADRILLKADHVNHIGYSTVG